MNLIRWIFVAAVSLLLMGKPAFGLTTLFSDSFEGVTSNASAWRYGTGSIASALATGDSFSINTSSALLVVSDAAPYSSGSPVVVHSISGSNFYATADKVLQLNMELTITNSAVVYTLGLFDSSSPAYAVGANSIALSVVPGATSNNVTLYATGSSGAVVSTVTTTVMQSQLIGTHNYALQVDYIASTVSPVVRAYSNGVLLATLTFTANDGIHPQASGASQGTAVRPFVRGVSTTGSGASFALKRVNLYSYTPGALLSQLQASRAVNRGVFGQNILAGEEKYYYSMYGNGFWNPATMTYSSILVNKAKSELGTVTSLRYPGGGMACRFDFRKTIGPVSDRVDATDTDGSGNVTVKGKWSFGLDEFMSLCKTFGAEPMYTAPDVLLPAAQMPEHVANLVEYLNAPATAGNPWAVKRQTYTGANASGYGVRYFEMGNETYYLESEMNALTYSAYVRDGGWAMRAVDPSVQIGVVAKESGRELQNDWDATVLENTGSVVDFVILHIYQPFSSTGDKVYSDPIKVEKTAMAMGDYLEYQLKATHDTIDVLAGKRLPLAITEFNAQLVNKTVGVPTYRLSYALGMQMSDMLRVFLKPEYGVITANYWQMFSNSYGPLSYNLYATATASTTFREYPAYPVFKLWGQHFKGSTLLTTTVSGPQSSYPGYRGIAPAMGSTYQPEAYLGSMDLTATISSQIASINTDLAGAGTATATMNGDALQIVFNGYDSNRGGSLGNWPQIATHTYSSPGRYDYVLSYEARYVAGATSPSRPLWITAASEGDTTSNLTMDPIVNSSYQPFYGWYRSEVSSNQATVTLNILSGSTATTSVTFSGTLQVRNMVMDLYRQESLPAHSIISSTASLSSDGNTYYVIVANKSNYAVPTTLSFSGFTGSSAKYWQVNTPTTWKADLDTAVWTVSGSAFALTGGASAAYTFPPHSMTAIEVYK